MKPKRSKKELVDICKCGHELRQHEICECPTCEYGAHDCYAKVRKGNNNDFCECVAYELHDAKEESK